MAEGRTEALYRLLRVQQPEPFDVIDGRILIAGYSIAFEANLNVIVRDATGAVVVHTHFMTAGGDVWSNWQTQVDLPVVPATPSGFVEVTDRGGADLPVTLVTVPVVFGTALVPGYRGFQLRMVQPGDTLSASPRTSTETPRCTRGSSRRTATRSPTPASSSRASRCECRWFKGS